MYGCFVSTPVSRSAIETPRPSKPGSETPGLVPAPAASPPFSIRLDETEAGYVTRTGYTPATSGALSR